MHVNGTVYLGFKVRLDYLNGILPLPYQKRHTTSFISARSAYFLIFIVPSARACYILFQVIGSPVDGASVGAPVKH